MTDTSAISPAAPENHGLDYAWLKEEGTRLVQQLASDIWTDYNEHDPGVTTLEQLCYALTDLSYRAEFPLRDLLIDPRSGKIDTRRQALFIPRRILPCNALTQNDYRKLLTDRVDGIANAWLTPHRSAGSPVDGLYDIALYAPGADPCACDENYQPERIRAQAKAVYCRHRNLCEDEHDIFILEPLVTRVSACATIDDSRAAETILADLLFNLGNFLAPELRRWPLKSLIDRGLTADEIFEGPLLRHGFIADEQLQPKATSIALSSLVRVMVRTPGVIGLRDVSVQIVDNEPYVGARTITVPARNILQLDTRPDPDGFSISLWRKGVAIKPDPARVRRELDRLWNDYRRTYPLTPQYQQYFAVPQGQRRDLITYYSVQNQYPNVYGINTYGLPDDATDTRRGQARQLKGYLLAFEQLLADFLAQLSQMRNLFSTEPNLPQTYFYQYLDRSVPNVAPLLRRDYHTGLARIVRGADPVIERRNRFLDFLLALYGERLDASMLANTPSDDAQHSHSAESLLRAKLELLHHLVASTRDRGRGFDYLARSSPRNVAGMEIKSRIQLGMDVSEDRLRADILAELALEIVETDGEASIGRPLSGAADHIEESFAIPQLPTAARAMNPDEPPSPLRGQRTTEAFLRAARAPGNYRVGSIPGEDAIIAVCKSPGESQWRFAGRHPDEQRAFSAIACLSDQAEMLCHHFSRLYIVEHTLLRFGRSDEEQSERELNEANGREDFVYSFTITAVVALPRDISRSDAYRTLVHEVIRENAPAHIALDCCFLHGSQTSEFEHRYGAWRAALRNGDPERKAETSRRLRRFLARHRERPTSSAPARFGEQLP